MDPVILSDTCQEYAGVRYYLCGSYFQRDGVRLHRKVWQDANGPIERGWHVHHDNHDRSDNSLTNLVLLPGREHLEHHAQKGVSRRVTPQALAAAAEWHRSSEGQAWHKLHGKASWENRQQDKPCTCDQCGKDFLAWSRNQSRFCSNACKSAWRRQSGLDDVEKVCAECGGVYIANKYAKASTCSRACGQRSAARKRSGLQPGG